MEGWISLHRKILENPILNRSRIYSNFEAWIWLLLKANHKDNKFVLGSEVLEVKKGQMITSQKKLCKQFRWGSTKLRTFLKLLQSDQMIELKPSSKATHITVCNYDTYQDYQTANKSLPNRKQIATKSLPKTNNKDNNVNNVNKLYNYIYTEINLKKYGKNVLDEFYGYWTEKKIGGNKTLYEMQKTFDVDRRLSNWVKRDYNGTYKTHLEDNAMKQQSIKQQKEEQKYTEEADPEEFGDYMKEISNEITKGMKGN